MLVNGKKYFRAQRHHRLIWKCSTAFWTQRIFSSESGALPGGLVLTEDGPIIYPFASLSKFQQSNVSTISSDHVIFGEDFKPLNVCLCNGTVKNINI